MISELTLSSLNSKERRHDDPLVKDSLPVYSAIRRTAWKDNLLRAIALYCGCSFYSEKNLLSNMTDYFLVGRRNDIFKAKILWNWFSFNIHKLAANKIGGNGRVAINSYCLGFVQGIVEVINNSPDLLSFKSKQEESRLYADLVNYEVSDASSPCCNFVIDSVAFELGKMEGVVSDLDAIINNVV